MASHLLHYIVPFAVHLIIDCQPSNFIIHIFVDFVGQAGLGSHLIIELLILLNFNLRALLLCTFVLLSFLLRIRFCFFKEYSFSLFISCIECDYANLGLILSFAALLTCQKDVWQKHDSLFQSFQFLFF